MAGKAVCVDDGMWISVEVQSGSTALLSQDVCTQKQIKAHIRGKDKICDLEEYYLCGSVLFPPASTYHSTIVTRVNLTCWEQYYSTLYYIGKLSTSLFPLWKSRRDIHRR